MESGIRSNGSACDVCLESTYASIDNKLLTSILCGHRVCPKCLKQQARETVTEATESQAARDSIRCPICLSSLTSWVDRSADDSVFEQERLVRQRILGVYTLTRENFEGTPLYNDYLEQRENTIYELAFGNDPSRRKSLQEEVQAMDIQNQKQIAECKQKERQREEEDIKNIVAKEGTFYELVALDYGPGFRYSKAAENNLVHPLQRQFPHLFMTDGDSALQDSSGQPSVSGIGGGSQLPRPIQSGVVYEKIPKKQPTDTAAMLRACGYFKERLLQRVTSELYGGLSFALSDTSTVVHR